MKMVFSFDIAGSGGVIELLEVTWGSLWCPPRGGVMTGVVGNTVPCPAPSSSPVGRPPHTHSQSPTHQLHHHQQQQQQQLATAATTSSCQDDKMTTRTI